MKFSLVVLAGFVTLALASEGETVTAKKVADKAYLEKQKLILPLFLHLNQPSYLPEHVEIAEKFSFADHVDSYKKSEVVKHFVQYHKYGLLPKGEIFSVFHQEHLDQAIALFQLFWHADTFETFYKTAVWARQNVNEGMFLYAFSVAITHRPDTYMLVLPRIYEIYPHYFYNSEVINDAYYYKQTHHEKHEDLEEQDNWKGYTVFANYTGDYVNVHPEQSMAYYLEDVGVNSFYYTYNIHFPFWMSKKQMIFKPESRGEYFYFMYQQYVARYYLERLSNGLGEIPFFNWDVPVETPYYPALTYPNGLEFPQRPKFANLHEYFYNYGQKWTWNIYGYSYTIVQNLEKRLNDIIDQGFIMYQGNKIEFFTKKGFNVLANFIESNADSLDRKFYGPLQVFARHLLGYSMQALDSHKLVPSALEHFETSSRDPVFYQFWKRVVLMFQRYIISLPSYTNQDLTFPGVKIINVEIDPLWTYFENFYSSLSNAVFDTPQELEHNTFHIRARQYRLNHKPFTVKVTVNSDKDVKAYVKIFLGPKYDEYGRIINMTENRLNMVQLDYFAYELKSGQNVISRDCDMFAFFGPDRMTFHDLSKKVMGALEGHEQFTIGEHPIGQYPQRLMLPRGTHDGMAYQFFVFVYPVNGQEDGDFQYEQEKVDGKIVNDYPIGYPLNRHIKFEQMWSDLPNAYSHEAKIFHKNVDEMKH